MFSMDLKYTYFKNPDLTKMERLILIHFGENDLHVQSFLLLIFQRLLTSSPWCSHWLDMVLSMKHSHSLVLR